MRFGRGHVRQPALVLPLTSIHVLDLVIASFRCAFVTPLQQLSPVFSGHVHDVNVRGLKHRSASASPAGGTFC